MPELTRARLREILHYDPDTGMMTWKERLANRIHPGDSVGYPNTRGHLQTKINGRPYLVHRLAFFYMTGRWPSVGIDHINGIKTDNRWINLREANQSQNAANAKKRVDNASGYKGVTWHKGMGKWQARIGYKGKRINLGYFDTPKEAAAAYRAKAEELFGNFTRPE